MKTLALALTLALLASPALAAGSFCDGFTAGWQAAFRSHNKGTVSPPGCPGPSGVAPTYENGFAAGMEAALAAMN